MESAGLSLIRLTVLLSLLLFSCLPKEEPIEAPPLLEPEQLQYNTITVAQGVIVDSFSCIAGFVSVKQYEISFNYREGVLKGVYVKTGDQVVKGQLLAELDTGSLEKDIEKQRIILQTAEELYNHLVENGDIDIKLAQIQLNRLHKERERQEAIKSDIPLSDIEYKDLEIKKQELEITKLEAEYREKMIIAWRDKETARIELEDLQLEMKMSRLYAPIAGTISFTAPIYEGEIIEAKQNFIRIADPHHLQLEYTNDDFYKLALGLKVDVEIGSLHYKGEVIMTPTNAPKEFYDQYRKTVFIKVFDYPKQTEIGTRAQVNAILSRKEDVIVLPKYTLHNFGDRNYVNVLDENGIIRNRDVEIGIVTTTEFEVIKGLEIGEKVVQ